MKAYCMKKVAHVFRKTKVAAATLCVGAVGFAAVGPALAQSSSSKVPSERAKYDAEKVFSWMKLQVVDPKKVAPAQPATAPAKDEKAVAAAKPAPKPAAKSDVTLASNDAKAAAAAQTLENEPTAAGSAPAGGASTDSTAMLANPGMAAAAIAGPAAAASIPEPEAEEPIQLIPVSAVKPEFPASLMRKLGKGRVQVAFDIQTDGSLADVRVVSSSSPRLNSYVLAALEEWKFRPIARAQSAGTEFVFDDSEE